MKAVRTKLGKGGRIIIPTAFRQNLHLETGDDIILHMEDNLIYLTTAEQALRTLQNKVKNYINTTGQDISLTDELITMRRNEAKYE
ncbi:AbrB/MazE/SpoVT family DNA-binding domain-containing antitoxin [Candidatus Megaera venefica]|uniref:AbrB/MazE/SpoVT family DNA-binding domain-containing antitoxin n=1 Tax=Candidatus Megaera venefica TaxID=2055910 RepID=A0ABU5NF51_9RICK|nr:AbrB/MazE/SpoVT family DNA-binding domain-containing protein [Candidatus Megaera venefica]MEA0971784.1 AbrB/MazE/SpoVT family DNA-binding domain-containing antitoxin [Candidatus Megaera venefica]